MNSNWSYALADFLQHQPGVSAVRIDAQSRKVSVATLGEVDLKRLEISLAQTIAAIESQLTIPSSAPKGFILRRDGAITEIAGDSSETTSKLWQWREFAWPDLVAEEKKAAGLRGLEHDESEWKELAIFASACAVFGIAGAVTESMNIGPWWLGHALYAIALVAGGYDAAKESWEHLRKYRLDIHFLMLAVAIGAACVGAWGEAALLLFLFSASGAMEEYALDRTHREVSALLKTAPKKATLILPNGEEKEISIEQLQVGERVIVKPGDAFPADGVVAKGKSASDESALTGEAVPVEKNPGDKVFSGTLNLWGVVEYNVARLPA
ncbi:MAG: cation-transporting P-type ATPase, partial [Opitutaceae bacterium]